MTQYKTLLNFSKKVRLKTLKVTVRSKSAHIASNFSIIEILTVLYKLRIKKFKDIFILSKGHACLSLYVVLSELNYFKKALLNDYGQDGTDLMSHTNHKINGVEFSTGSLGHGLSYAVGKCIGLKIKKIKKKVFVLLSDGELNEGSNWEAFMFAAHHNLDNLVVIIDYNKIQSLDFVEKVIKMKPLKSKFKNFGFDVRNINGHNFNELKKNLFLKNQKKPLVVIANTIKGKGVKEMENKVLWHYKPPTKMQYLKFKKEILK